MDAEAETDVVRPVEDNSSEETGPEQDHGGRPELKQGEILRTLATVEKDSQAIAESFSSLFVSLRSTLSEIASDYLILGLGDFINALFSFSWNKIGSENGI
ncbi:unnamed protein product [Arabidopsis lyrata]|nr:unnamed protein product [Arabidopsis lyrata]